MSESNYPYCYTKKVCKTVNFNLYEANPFDSRKYPQYNEWCSNELILKDKNLRCLARVQPLDIVFNQSLKNIGGNMSR